MVGSYTRRMVFRGVFRLGVDMVSDTLPSNRCIRMLLRIKRTVDFVRAVYVYDIPIGRSD